MNKAYTRINFQNDHEPALNEDNLNAMSEALDLVDTRLVQLAGDVIEKAHDIMELSENPPYIGANGNWWTWDTNTGEYVDSGIDASITVEIADVTALAPDASPYVTNTGTNTDPIFHLFIPRGQNGTNGEDGVSVTGVTLLSTSGKVKTYRMTFSDGTHFDYNVTDGEDGGSGGDMLKSVYDPNDDGIIDIAQGGTGANTASAARTALGLGDVATHNIGDISSNSNDIPTGRTIFNRYETTKNYALLAYYSTYRKELILEKVNVTGTQYTFNFGSAYGITDFDTNYLVDVYNSIYGENPTSVAKTSAGVITVTFAESKSRTVVCSVRQENG